MKFVRLSFLLLLALPLFGGERYIVEFNDGPAVAQARDGIARDRIRREFSRVLRGVAIELHDGESIDAIRALPQVARVTPDTIVEAFETPEKTATATRVVTNGGGSGVIVAVIDSGIDYTHPALGAGFGAGKKVVGGYDFVNDDADPMDDNRHGTHVAGIIAAQSNALTGLAPKVTLLAYKVLGADGKGYVSDIIAAVERAIADHADIINLSLGGPGNPDDPLSRAIDNASAHNVVVCVAAGNEGVFHAIGSPAGAASAITVGASSGNTVAEFSTRGPATVSGAIKPDLLAPGVAIVSTVPGGGTQAMSGTSMATPYVSALAALLREEHPSWTSARIKAAIVTTASPIANEEVMTQGSGVVDRVRVFANVLVVSSTQLNFGLDGAITGAWQQTRRVSIRNDSATQRTIHASATGTSDAIAIDIAPAEIDLAPGEAREFEMTLRVDNDVLGAPPAESLAFSGVLALEAGEQSLRLPWAFLRAARATITYEDSFPNVMWRRLADGYESYAPIHPNGLEILLKPGTYDFAVIGENDGDVRLFIAEDRVLNGEASLAFTKNDAPHEIRFDAEMPEAQGPLMLYTVRARLLFPDGAGSTVLPEIAGRAMHTSSMSSRYGILPTESLIDGNAAEVIIAQHPAVQGVSSDVLLHVDANAYARQAIEIHFPADSAIRDLVVMPRDWPRSELEFGPMPQFLRLSSSTRVWKGVLSMTPEMHEDFASGLQISTLESEEDLGFWAMTTPMIRRDGSGFFSVQGFVKPQLPLYAVANEPLRFGDGVLRPSASFVATASYLAGEPRFRGDRDESRRATKLDAHYRLFDGANVELASGEVPVASWFVPLPGRGRYRAEVRTRKEASGLLTMNFDTTAADLAPPSFTWMSIHDAQERRATRLPLNGSGTLVFAAKNSSSARTSVFFRRHAGATWVQLTPMVIEEDENAGTVYRVDLTDALRIAGELDLMLEIGDASGNTTTWQLDRALTSVSEPVRSKRRAVR
jgi:hypothetical protein